MSVSRCRLPAQAWAKLARAQEKFATNAIMWNYPQFLAREKSEKAGASKNPRTRSHSHPTTGRKVQAQQLPDNLPVKKKTIMKNTKHQVDQKKIQTERQNLEISSNIPELKKDEIINELKKEIENWKHQGLASYNLITQLDTYSDNQPKQEALLIVRKKILIIFQQ
uniref:Uncharacterized protein n=1 Tax=Trichogramma kaykai TaxID=54128 RepID=A0ABD2WC06_9HYME